MKRIFFAKFASDRFLITWNSYKEGDNFDPNMSKITKSYNRKVLTVTVEYDEETVMEHEMRTKPGEVEKKVEQSLDIHQKEL